jgi:hypothetical protein
VGALRTRSRSDLPPRRDLRRRDRASPWPSSARTSTAATANRLTNERDGPSQCGASTPSCSWWRPRGAGRRAATGMSCRRSRSRADRARAVAARLQRSGPCSRRGHPPRPCPYPVHVDSSSSTSIDSIYNSFPPTATAAPPRERQRKSGSSGVHSAAQEGHNSRAATGACSSRAPSHRVPRAATANASSSVDGTTWRSAPTQTHHGRPPPASVPGARSPSNSEDAGWRPGSV